MCLGFVVLLTGPAPERAKVSIFMSSTILPAVPTPRLNAAPFTDPSFPKKLPDP